MLILYLDPDFLKNTLKYFINPKIGMVQTRWEHLNENYSILTRIQALALKWSFCNGTANKK